MVRGNIKLDNPSRFAGKYEIPAEKIREGVAQGVIAICANVNHKNLKPIACPVLCYWSFNQLIIDLILP